MPQDKKPQVIIIGAGPIGLIYAWGIKNLNPEIDVVVFEKYQEYQRNHTLNMQHKHLLSLMKATNTEDNPKLLSLLKQLKKNPHIRTDKLQKIYTELALEKKVAIHYNNEINKENIQTVVLDKYPEAQFIIGADGTHSVTSSTLFPENNQIKHKFDFVLQLRYEIEGESKTEGINVLEFYQQMARHGLIANEYVGVFQDNKTPVTMQMMISEEDYNLLKKASSKNPIKPYDQNAWPAEEKAPKLPFHLQQFINTYLCKKTSDITGHQQKIDEKSIKISVNEAPATQAKQIICSLNDIICLLVGDAALGLSYFKGLNAGDEAAAKFFNIFGPSIRNSFKNREEIQVASHKYQQWFIKKFAPLKIREVSNYSFWNIRSLMSWINVVHQLKIFSYQETEPNMEPALQDYFNYYRSDMSMNRKNWNPFPHRKYNLVKIGQFEKVPTAHHLKKMGKLFADYLQPYKGKFQIMQDLKQPFFGLANLSIGLLKIVNAPLSLNSRLLLDGIISCLRGIIELITTPLTWLIKPLFRGIATWRHGGYQNIEDNRQLIAIAQEGLNLLDGAKVNYSDPKESYKLLARCNDLHRKFDKSVSRGQRSDLLIKEATTFTDLRNDRILNPIKIRAYFTLFGIKNNLIKEEDKSETNSKGLGYPKGLKP